MFAFYRKHGLTKRSNSCWEQVCAHKRVHEANRKSVWKNVAREEMKKGNPRSPRFTQEPTRRHLNNSDRSKPKDAIDILRLKIKTFYF